METKDLHERTHVVITLIVQLLHTQYTCFIGKSTDYSRNTYHYCGRRHTRYIVIVLLWFPSSASAVALQAVKPQPNWLVCTLQPRKQDPSKQSVVVCKHKECVMASCAEGHGFCELLGDELFVDYFDDTTNLSSSGSASKSSKQLVMKTLRG